MHNTTSTTQIVMPAGRGIDQSPHTRFPDGNCSWQRLPKPGCAGGPGRSPPGPLACRFTSAALMGPRGPTSTPQPPQSSSVINAPGFASPISVLCQQYCAGQHTRAAIMTETLKHAAGMKVSVLASYLSYLLSAGVQICRHCKGNPTAQIAPQPRAPTCTLAPGVWHQIIRKQASAIEFMAVWRRQYVPAGAHPTLSAHPPARPTASPACTGHMPPSHHAAAPLPLQSVKDMPRLQDVAPPGGFPSIRIDRRLPSTGPTGATIFAVGGAIMAYGYYKVCTWADDGQWSRGCMLRAALPVCYPACQAGAGGGGSSGRAARGASCLGISTHVPALPQPPPLQATHRTQAEYNVSVPRCWCCCCRCTL